MSDLNPKVFSTALEALERRAQRARYVNDPVAWAKDMLDQELWSKQKEVAESVRDNRKTAVAAGHGVGKLLDQEEWHITPTGWVQTKDITPGAELFDEQGCITRVTGLSPWWDQDVYRVTFDDGETVEAGENHEWDVLDLTKRSRANGTKSGVKDWRDRWDAATRVTTKEMFDSLRTPSGQLRWKIPLAKPLQMPEADLPIDPYLLGFWLGDGTASTGAITIGESKRALIEWLTERSYEFVVRELDREAEGATIFIPALRVPLKTLGVLDNKHIPTQYLRASEAQRRELLAGLMDSDGFVMKAHGGPDVGIDLTREALFEGVVELVKTLGCSVRRSTGEAAYTLDGVRHVTGTRYRANWRPLENPFKIRGETWADTATQRSRHTARTVVSVEFIERRKGRCIEVDSPSHLYLGGSGLIPTHNSHVAAILMCWWIDVHPLDEVFVASTAPFQAQISAILWKQVRVFHALANRRFAQGLIDHPLPGYITSQNEWKTDDGIIIGQGRKPPDGETDSGFQGLHATYLLAIGDEAAGLGAQLIDGLTNITTGEHNRMLLIANPTDPSSAMAKLWKTKDSAWNLMHISVFDSPKITGEDFPADRMTAITGWDYINERKTEWGESDPRYISRVTGQWAFDAGNSVFADTDLARAANCVVIPDPDAKPRQGWDIARSAKGDYTVGYTAIEGEVWETDPQTGNPVRGTGQRGLQVRLIDKWQGAPLVGADPDNPGSATRIDRHALGEGAWLVAIDSAGLGSGVIDGLRDLGFGRGKYQVFEYYGSGPTTDRRAFTNQRAQHYFALKDMMFAGMIDLDAEDETVMDELRGILYEYDSKGAKKIESKDDMKRKGKKSPDFADAVIYASFDMSPFLEGETVGMKPGDGKVVPARDIAREVTAERRARRFIPV
ncbi:hypothetical protein [Microbacterium sp.]|uniref:hypothetical protein n=1 Tax=Microbacterium sp. TaxID=51671 RepID=UPI0039E51794